jgi:stringent starvation protein B
MTSTRPYLIRAIYDWASENNLTPHLLVDATMQGVSVPEQYITDGTITLNVSMSSVRGLELGDEWVLFSARFAGKEMNIEVPIPAVQAIYARENGQGIFFPQEEDEGPEPDDSGDNDIKDKVAKPDRPALKVIK